ncbi:MAG TPA: hypothetical protein VEI06_09580 [Gemmatimonadaceae bacterium]|nr:hypothetical protein [Gemmatimonadaceae bacterium]
MRRVMSLILLASLIACEKIGSGGKTNTAATTTPTGTDSITALNAKLSQAQSVSAQQDSLLQSFNQTTQLLADIDKELSKVKGLQSHVPLDVKNGDKSVDQQAAYRASILGKVQEVTALLAKSRSRVASANSKNEELNSQIEQYKQTIANFETMVEQDKQQIAMLASKVDSLNAENAQVTAAKNAVTDTMLTLRKENNTVYYVVGTKDELIKKGIVVEEGTKFLFFGHKELVPAHRLDPSSFTAINKWDDSPITLHITDKPYKVISRQDPGLIEAGKTTDGKMSGELHITQPADFWGATRYLIIVEGA